MQAICRINVGKDLGPYRGRGPFHTDQTNFALNVGETYEIFGMSIFNNALSILVHHETWHPWWVPHEILEIAPSKLPYDWYFAVQGPTPETEGRWKAEWGYLEFVQTLKASEDLANGTYQSKVAFHERIRQRRDPPPEYERVPSTPDEWVRGTCRIASDLPLTVGRSYDVHGMALLNAVLVLLVEDDLGGPCLAPHGLFDIEPMRLPDDWYCTVHGGDGLEAVWGYEELTRSVEDFEALVAHRDDAVKAFRNEVARRG